MQEGHVPMHTLSLVEAQSNICGPALEGDFGCPDCLLVAGENLTMMTVL